MVKAAEVKAGMDCDMAGWLVGFARDMKAGSAVLQKTRRVKALLIEVRLLTEHGVVNRCDAAQARGLLRKPGRPYNNVSDGSDGNVIKTLEDCGFTAKKIHGWRQTRDIERDNPGCIPVVTEKLLADSDAEMTYADVRRGILEIDPHRSRPKRRAAKKKAKAPQQETGTAAQTVAMLDAGDMAAVRESVGGEEAAAGPGPEPSGSPGRDVRSVRDAENLADGRADRRSDEHAAGALESTGSGGGLLAPKPEEWNGMAGFGLSADLQTWMSVRAWLMSNARHFDEAFLEAMVRGHREMGVEAFSQRDVENLAASERMIEAVRYLCDEFQRRNGGV